MNCPRTGVALKKVEIAGVAVEISEGCGGIWFDNFELKHFDEEKDSSGEELIAIVGEHEDLQMDLTERINSPKHPDVVMMRRFYSPKRKIEIDECPKSGGIWLDPGELSQIRKIFPTDEERKQAVESLIREIFENPEIKALAKESEESLARAKHIANMVKWLCPSAYLPGKQDWGSF